MRTRSDRYRWLEQPHLQPRRAPFTDATVAMQLGAKGVFVQADNWRLAGDIVDGQDVEAGGAIAEAASG